MLKDSPVSVATLLAQTQKRLLYIRYFFQIYRLKSASSSTLGNFSEFVLAVNTRKEG